MNARATPPFSAPQQVRLVRLLGMLGSDHDGEIANAGRMAHRLVQSLGLSWTDIIVGGAALRAPKRAPKAPKTSKSPRDPLGPRTWGDLCRQVVADETAPSWERQFCREILDNFHGEAFSRRQISTLRRILEERRRRARSAA